MARVFPPSINQAIPGKLLVEEYHPGFNEVYFVPPKENLEKSGMDAKKPEIYKIHILDVDATKDYVSIFPFNAVAGKNKYLKPKYEGIGSITLDGFSLGSAESTEEVVDLLEELPSAFLKDYDYGLGLQYEYRFLIHLLEKFGIKHLFISKEDETCISKETQTCTIKFQEFETIRKSLNKITRDAQSSARKVKVVTTNNLMSFFLNSVEYPQKELKVKDDVLEKLIVKASSMLSVGLSKAEQNEAIALIDKNKKVIAKDNPKALVKLQNDLELVTLEQLIEKYEAMLKKRLNESYWQKVFNENPFILNMAFGYPIIKIHDQASVGGRKLTGEGEKITDFFAKNSITNNSAIFEIKTPRTKLLNKTVYRDGVYTPSSDLSGSINQVLDQKYKFQKEISSIKDNTRLYDIESYNVHCVLIIGQMPEDLDQQKSFELFRRNSKDVEIVTFDELLEKLKQLYAFLSANDEDT